MAQNAIFGWPRWTPDITWSGGSWSASWPVSNVGSLPLARVARSSNTTLAATQIIGTLSRDRPLQLFGLVRHNLTAAARYRLRLYGDAARTILLLDTNWLAVWPEVYPYGTLEWEDDAWWTGTYSDSDLAGYTWTRPLWLGQLLLARAFLLEFDDTANVAGYVEIGMVEVAQGWQPSLNMAYGYQTGWRSRSPSVEALGGAKYFDRRDKPRIVRGDLTRLPRDEAMARGFEMQRVQDADQPLLWFPFPDEPFHWVRDAMLARLVDPGLLGFPFYNRMTFPFSLEEVL